MGREAKANRPHLFIYNLLATFKNFGANLGEILGINFSPGAWFFGPFLL